MSGISTSISTRKEFKLYVSKYVIVTKNEKLFDLINKSVCLTRFNLVKQYITLFHFSPSSCPEDILKIFFTFFRCPHLRDLSTPLVSAFQLNLELSWKAFTSRYVRINVFINTHVHICMGPFQKA